MLQYILLLIRNRFSTYEIRSIVQMLNCNLVPCKLILVPLSDRDFQLAGHRIQPSAINMRGTSLIF